ncbi:MAG: SOS response-associated peptidase [Zavarzinella sp.]
MCGRFTLHAANEELQEQFYLETQPQLSPRFNIAPTQLVAVVGKKTHGGKNGLQMFRWGFLPSWANDATGHRPVNAMLEGIAQKPMFREAIQKRRCLIPASGFYEWKQVGKQKIPVFIRRTDRVPLAFAGIWERWQSETESIFTCAILTTAADQQLQNLHHRMPVMLPPEQWDIWLDRTTTFTQLEPELKKLPTVDLELLDANPILNNARNETPECLAGIPHD